VAWGHDRAALYALNFMADMQAGMGSHSGMLLQACGWTIGAIGTVSTMGAHEALLASQRVMPIQSFETLICLFRDRVQFCLGLVDLVVCVRHHGRGGHRLTLLGERFIGLVAEDFAEVGDRGGDLRERAALSGLTAKPGIVAAGS
jgi:hypothetical protein